MNARQAGKGEGGAGPVIMILAAASLWSTIGIASVYSGAPLLASLVRSVVAAAAAIPIYRSFNKAAAAAGASLGFLFGIYSTAAAVAGVGLAAFLLYTAPLWTAIFSLVIGETPGRLGLAGLGMISAAVAIAMIDAVSGGASLLGVALGLASGASYGAYISIARLFSRAGMGRDVSYGALPYATIITVPLFLISISRGLVVMPSQFVKPMAAGAYLGVLCTVVPYRLFSLGVSRLRATLAAMLATLEPVLAAVWGYVFLGQVPNAYEYAIYALITAALIVSSLEAR